MTRVHVNPASLILVLALVGGGYWIYTKYEEAQRQKLQAYLDAQKAEREREERLARLAEERAAARAAQEEAERLARMEAERSRAEAEKSRAQAELERQRLMAEERQKREEAERALRLVEEQARLAAEEEARRRAEEEAEQMQAFSVSTARKALAEARTALRGLEGEKTEIERSLVASRNRLEGAKKQMADALSRARKWASEQGVKVVDPDRPWGGDGHGGAATQSQNDAAFVLVQDNREQIARERAKYNVAKREADSMEALILKDTARLPGIAKKISDERRKEESAKAVLMRFGVNPDAKEVSFPEAPVQVEGIERPSRIIRMKDGRSYEVEKAMDAGDVLSVKVVGGGFVVLKKAEIAEIPPGILP